MVSIRIERHLIICWKKIQAIIGNIKKCWVIWKATEQGDLTGKDEKTKMRPPVIYAPRRRRFAGGAVAASPYAKIAWRRIFGACPAMVLPGSVQIVAPKMDMGINNHESF